MAWLHWVQPRYPHHQLEVMATDIDENSLVRAQRCLYGASSLREVPLEVRDTWFVPSSGGLFRLDKRVAASVTFRRHHLLKDPPLKAHDLVLCRYLAFTYYLGQRQQAVINRLRASLRPGGVLVVGRHESLDAVAHDLELWPGQVGIYVAPEDMVTRAGQGTDWWRTGCSP